MRLILKILNGVSKMAENNLFMKDSFWYFKIGRFRCRRWLRIQNVGSNMADDY